MSSVLEQLILDALKAVLKQFVTEDLLKAGEKVALQWLYDQSVAAGKPEIADLVKSLAADLGVVIP